MQRQKEAKQRVANHWKASDALSLAGALSEAGLTRRSRGSGFEGHPRERAKKSFLAAMSHELRTPLNAIIGFAEIIDAEVFGPLSVPQYRGYVRDILGSAQHLLQIVEDVLEISRAEYVRAQQSVAQRAAPLRAILAARCDLLLTAAAGE